MNMMMEWNFISYGRNPVETVKISTKWSQWVLLFYYLTMNNYLHDRVIFFLNSFQWNLSLSIFSMLFFHFYAKTFQSKLLFTDYKRIVNSDEVDIPSNSSWLLKLTITLLPIVFACCVNGCSLYDIMTLKRWLIIIRSLIQFFCTLWSAYWSEPRNQRTRCCFK